MKTLTDLIIEKSRLAPTCQDLSNVTGSDVFNIARELTPYALVWSRVVLKNPANNKPFEEAITALVKEAIRKDPDYASLDRSQLPKAADCLRLATIEAVLKGIEAGQITPPDDVTIPTAPVITPVGTPVPPQKRGVIAMPTAWTGTK